MVALLLVVSDSQLWVGNQPMPLISVGTSSSQRIVSVLGLVSALHIAAADVSSSAAARLLAQSVRQAAASGG